MDPRPPTRDSVACARRAPRTSLLNFPAFLAASCAVLPGAHAGDIWADRVVYAVHDGEAIYDPDATGPGTPGLGTPLTFGPFNPANPLWQDPADALGPPNTIDYDDLTGFGPVPGGFAGGPMRRVHLAWPAWQWGSTDPSDLGTRPGWLDGRPKNGVGLTQAAQLVVEFDEPVTNNPPDGGAFHWGIDLIVHGNAGFATTTAVAAGANLNALMLTGGLLAEPIEIAVAQTPEGPWYTTAVAGDALFPTQPWAWDRGANGGTAGWSGEPQDWTKPVDPALTLADFAGIAAADAIDLYAGSAGGAGIDLSALVDHDGDAASLGWIRFVRFRDPDGNGGEVCALADVPNGPDGPDGDGPGCNPADLAEPFAVLDLADIGAFVSGFTGADAIADLAEPAGVFDLADIGAFVNGFSGGCP